MFARPAKAKRRNIAPPVNTAAVPGSAATVSHGTARPRGGIGNQAALRRLGNGGGSAPPIVHDALRRPGKPLAPPLRAAFEARLGADLGAVRLHDDAMAARSARAVGALAYTAGSHIVFDQGKLAPARPEGFALLAHELAHVIQARAGSDDGMIRRQTPDDEPKKDPKPLAQVGDYTLSFLPFLPLPSATPGGGGPSPYDPPGKVTDPPGKTLSTEDANKAFHMLTDKDKPKLGLNTNAKLPDCSRLEAVDSTKAARKYWRFEQYDLQRKMLHSPLSGDPWPALSREQYNAAIQACPKGDGPAKADPPAAPAAPAPTPTQTLPPPLAPRA
jgi:hypothetical protein